MAGDVGGDPGPDPRRLADDIVAAIEGGCRRPVDWRRAFWGRLSNGAWDARDRDAEGRADDDAQR